MNSTLVKTHPYEVCPMKRLEVTNCKDCPRFNKDCMTTRIRVDCAWCKKVIGFRDGMDIGNITHGICEECESKF